MRANGRDDGVTSESMLGARLKGARGALLCVGAFSFVVNLLMLTGPLFMLQVYDRVLTSRSVPTLVALFGLVAFLYLVMGLFDFLRARVLSRLGYGLDVGLMERAQRRWTVQGLFPSPGASRPANDLGALRQFLGSNALPALFDLPWVPIYLLVVFALHPALGVLATLAALAVTALTVLGEVLTRRPLGEAVMWEGREARLAAQIHRNAEAVVSMGMAGPVGARWQGARGAAMARAQASGNVTETLTAISKAVRLCVQSGVLALGAYLAILGEITPGTMIAASILGGRALAPVDQVVGNWRNIARARLSYKRLDEAMGSAAAPTPPVTLPEPKGVLAVDGLHQYPPGEGGAQRPPILSGLSFDLAPGDALGVIGPSASGKSTLARLLVGLWTPDRGTVRLDGATFDQWDRDRLGAHVGYLPQTVELLSGTVRDNVARFDPDADDEAVVAAAKRAGVHDLILRLPDGYQTEIGEGGGVLSGGQRQRIALARAVYRTPPLVVLDEPNANLDAEGDAALTGAIRALREAGSTVVVMAHRPSAIAAVNLVLMLQDGRQTAFGPKEETLRQVTRPVPPRPQHQEVLAG